MAVLFASWTLELLAVLVALCAGIYVWFLIKFQYWKKRGIPFEEPSVPFGNLSDVIRQKYNVPFYFKYLYDNFDGHKLAGAYQFIKPTLIVRDPDEIKRILVKDFSSFHDRGVFSDEVNDPLTAHLFTMEGKKWRELRAKLSPTFTSGKMKMMFPTMVSCGIELKNYLLASAQTNSIIELKDLVARYSTDIIATCAFGIQSNSLKNPDSEFRQMGKKVFDFNFLTNLRFLLGGFFPALAKLSRLPLIPRDVSDFFRGAVRETVAYREANNVTRNDFMQLLIGLRNNQNLGEDDLLTLTKQNTEAGEGKGLTMDQVAANSFIFFVAGFETSSSTVSFCLYELAQNKEIQSRLRNEIDMAISKHGGQLTYEGIQEMEYLDRVVAETLRKYPAAGLLIRNCTKSYKLNEKITLDKGVNVVVSILGLHHDPKHYPNPELFDPERFTPEAKTHRHHYAYLPFGEGPRICIGSRFGLMQTKVAIASLISSYQFDACQQTAIPMIFSRTAFILASKTGIHLQISLRDTLRNEK